MAEDGSVISLIDPYWLASEGSDSPFLAFVAEADRVDDALAYFAAAIGRALRPVLQRLVDTTRITFGVRVSA